MTRIALAIALASVGGGQRFQRQCSVAQAVQYQTVAYAPVQAVYAAPYGVQTQFVAVENYADPYYASLVGSSVRGQQTQQSTRDTIGTLSAQVASLSTSVAQLTNAINGTASAPNQPPVVPPVNPNPQPPVVNPPVPPQPNVPPPPVPAGTAPAEVVSIFAAKCAKCHTTGALKKDAMPLFAEDGKTLLKFTPAQLLLIDQSVFSGDMPKNGQPLDSASYSAIRNWINDSKDEISASLKAQKGP